MEEILEINGKDMTIDEVIIECKKISALYKAGKLETVSWDHMIKG